METATRDYLKQRFRDYYDTETIPEPPDVKNREFGHMPWENDDRMVRHRSYLQMDDWQNYLASKRPRHIYMSAAHFDDPAASTMEDKHRTATTLVFDIDADHLPGVDDTTPYTEMLARGREEVIKLVGFLETDFGFTDVRVLFSGGRGYHVHVYDDGVKTLGKEQRRSIVDYVTGAGMSLDTVTVTEGRTTLSDSNASGRKTNSEIEQVAPDGWGRRVRAALADEVDRLTSLPREDAVAELTDMKGVGEVTAEDFLDTTVEDAVVSVNPVYRRLAEQVAEQVFTEQAAHVDEPVTTDLNRLIRLPESLHGGTALKVTDIDRDDLESFDPVQDAVPSEFQTGEDLEVRVTESTSGRVDGIEYDFDSGETVVVPESVGLFLMAQESAEYVSG